MVSERRIAIVGFGVISGDYNLNESLGYNRGAATNKTAPQTTNYPTNYPLKEVI